MEKVRLSILTSIPKDLLKECRIDARTKTEYELHYKKDLGEHNPDEGKPFTLLRLDRDYSNEIFCMSNVLFTNPHGAPDDEVALVCVPDGQGIMMEWERPISMSFLLILNSLLNIPLPGLRINFYPVI